MPELPEVEITRRALAPLVEGQLVAALIVRQARLRWPVPARLPATLRGRAVESLQRRGKYLLWNFAHGTMISHLGMSGSWRVHRRAAPPLPGVHDHVDLVVGEHLLRLTDPRRFGALLWHAARDGPVAGHPHLARLGVEPLDAGFDGAALYRATRGRRLAIKQLLLGGGAVVGVGNIYASESLFRAGIDPRTPAQRLGRVRCVRLAEAIRSVLSQAIVAGGSTLRNFVASDGAQGYFTVDANVYDRAAAPCRTCGRPIRRIVQGQRATYYCPRCQRA